MGEIFTAEPADTSPGIAGERLTGSTGRQLEIERLHRYLLARSLCRGKDVLAIAPGEDHGPALLAEVARSVAGVMVGPDAPAHAAQAHRHDNLQFLPGDARSIRLENTSVDVVVAFEVLEHVLEQDAFITEVRRVLRPGGLFIVGASDGNVYAAPSSPANPLHIEELARPELVSLLRRAFPYVECMLQRPMIGSAMLPDNDANATGPALTFERRGSDHFESRTGLPRALYVVAFAADHPIEIPHASLYIEASDLADREAQLAQAQVRAREERLAREAARSEATRERETAAHLRQTLAEASARLRAVSESTSWRLLEPARRMGRRHPGLARLVRRSLKLAWWAGARSDPSPPETVATTPLGGPEPASQPLSSEERVLEQERALGLEFAPPLAQNVTVGLATRDTAARDLRRIVSSARTALARARVSTERRVLLIDDSATTEAVTAGEPAVTRLPSCSTIGLGAAHNYLMQAAFEAGAEVYITAHPEGAFHPDAVTALLQMMQANEFRALVEAIQFPEEHPKVYDPVTFNTPWASRTCLAVPRRVFEKVGGFDETLFYFEDVDLSWRARAAGFPVKTCPRALFLHAVNSRPSDRRERMMLVSSGVMLARKWGAVDFEAALLEELRAAGCPPPEQRPPPVPEAWRGVADFSHLLSFAATRW